MEISLPSARTIDLGPRCTAATELTVISVHNDNSVMRTRQYSRKLVWEGYSRLHALQSGLSAARTNNIPPIPQPLPGPDTPRVELAGSAPALPAHAPDGDD